MNRHIGPLHYSKSAPPHPTYFKFLPVPVIIFLNFTFPQLNEFEPPFDARRAARSKSRSSPPLRSPRVPSHAPAPCASIGTTLDYRTCSPGQHSAILSCAYRRLRGAVSLATPRPSTPIRAPEPPRPVLCTHPPRLDSLGKRRHRITTRPAAASRGARKTHSCGTRRSLNFSAVRAPTLSIRCPNVHLICGDG